MRRIIIDDVLKEEPKRKEKHMKAPKARPKQMEKKH
jgi:hypothetical protein